MIRVESLSIQEFRGVRNLRLQLSSENYAICGPNGTGKSGIVDAVEFVLSGNISRLSGSGTGGLSIKEHGPHVDCRNRPALAYVTAVVSIPTLNAQATLTRSAKDPKSLIIQPDTPAIRDVIARVARHPEFVLSRRELIKYILAEPGQRSKEVMALLRLEQVEAIRATLQRISNASERDRKAKEITRKEAASALLGALGIPKLAVAELLPAVNERRATLSLPALQAFDAQTSIRDGLAAAAAAAAAAPMRVQKAEAQANLAALASQIDTMYSEASTTARSSVQESLATLIADEDFLKSATREDLLKKALEVFDGVVCPVCDNAWEDAQFREMIAAKLERYTAAAAQKQAIERMITPLLLELREAIRLCKEAQAIASLLKPPAGTNGILEWQSELEASLRDLAAILPLKAAMDRLTVLAARPKSIAPEVISIQAAVSALPEPSAHDAARDYLVIGQERLDVYRRAKLDEVAAEAKAKQAKQVFDIYGVSTTRSLEGIYDSVQETFSRLYRIINKEDEGEFEAKLKPSLGKLGFDVDFYGRGFFPPGAYHSEGHQDGMGLCLYLALMKHLAGDAFTFAVLDDVLMSVDSGHRREVSKLLRSEFPNTQFLLTTHDEIWLRHMKSVGLIKGKSAAHFRTWSVDVGPTEWSDRDVWDEIDSHLKVNDVRAAAALLRNYLEHSAKEICHQLRAPVAFRGDAQFTLGDLLPSGLGRLSKLLKQGKKTAQSWKQADLMEDLNRRERRFQAASEATKADQWQVNAAVHFNEWTNFSKEDFLPLVQSFKTLLAEFRCPDCEALLEVVPDTGTEQGLRCACSKVNINLRDKL